MWNFFTTRHRGHRALFFFAHWETAMGKNNLPLRGKAMVFGPAGNTSGTDDFHVPEACPAALRGSRETKKITHLGVPCDPVVNISYRIVAILADIPEDIPYIIIFIKACTYFPTMTSPKKWRIGTSGWSYKHWKELFYPPQVAASKWLG